MGDDSAGGGLVTGLGETGLLMSQRLAARS
jgi:hypothetical protein